MPYFSIVIPVYNKAAFLKATLDSVLAQSFTDFELILVNDGSTDDSAKVIAGFKDDRIKYFERKTAARRPPEISESRKPPRATLPSWMPMIIGILILQEMFRLTNRFAYEKILRRL
jgi:glycosyltransferase involved in cell wall biosynthesis